MKRKEIKLKEKETEQQTATTDYSDNHYLNLPIPYGPNKGTMIKNLTLFSAQVYAKDSRLPWDIKKGVEAHIKQQTAATT